MVSGTRLVLVGNGLDDDLDNPKYRDSGAWFRFSHIGFMGVGVANFFTIVDTGTNAHARLDP